MGQANLFLGDNVGGTSKIERIMSRRVARMYRFISSNWQTHWCVNHCTSPFHHPRRCCSGDDSRSWRLLQFGWVFFRKSYVVFFVFFATKSIAKQKPRARNEPIKWRSRLTRQARLGNMVKLLACRPSPGRKLKCVCVSVLVCGVDRLYSMHSRVMRLQPGHRPLARLMATTQQGWAKGRTGSLWSWALGELGSGRFRTSRCLS